MKDGQPAPKRSLMHRLWHGCVRPLIVIVVVVGSFRSAVADWHDVPSQSMEPTILTGDRILVNKLAYDLKVPFTTWRLAQWSDPRPGDIVTFYAPGSGTRLVKRIVGVPGDVIELRQNTLIINGTPLVATVVNATNVPVSDLADPGPFQFERESLGGMSHLLMEQPTRRAMRSFAPVTVPVSHYLVMGDNRDNSGDSRVFGFVPRDQILGRVYGIALSFDRRNFYAPRWERWIKNLD